MAERMKVEYHVIGEDGEAFAWEPDLSSAGSHCRPGGGAVRIEKVTSFYDERETVWEREPATDEEPNPHPYYPPGDPRRDIPYDERD